MILLTETINDTQMIVEASQDGRTMWLNGVCMQSTIKNRNGRVYPLQEIANAVNIAKQRISETNGIFGELDHPETLTINSDRISHVITEMWMDSQNAHGRIKLLNTPMGLIAQELLKSGVKVGVSSRGAGRLNESNEVQDFAFVTVDIVVTPSAPGATPNMMYESVMNQTGRKVLTLAEQVQHDAAAQKYFKKEIEQFIVRVLKK